MDSSIREEYLRERAKAATVAGDTDMASALNAEADTLGETAAPAEATPQ